MSELKRCPFCGGKAVTSTFFDWDDLEYMAFEVNDSDAEVTCENERCINGWWLTQKAWNTRPLEDALNARIAELEEENETLKTACDILRGDNNLLFKRLMSIETPGDLQTLKIVYVKEDSEVQE